MATTAHDGSVFQAGAPFGSTNPSAETGRWVAAMSAACSSVRSAAKTLVELRRVDRELPDRAPSPFGYCRSTRAVFSTLSVEPFSTSSSFSPSSGANAAT